MQQKLASFPFMFHILLLLPTCKKKLLHVMYYRYLFEISRKSWLWRVDDVRISWLITEIHIRQIIFCMWHMSDQPGVQCLLYLETHLKWAQPSGRPVCFALGWNFTHCSIHLLGHGHVFDCDSLSALLRAQVVVSLPKIQSSSTS